MGALVSRIFRRFVLIDPFSFIPCHAPSRPRLPHLGLTYTMFDALSHARQKGTDIFFGQLGGALDHPSRLSELQLAALPTAGSLRRPLQGFLGLGTAFNALMLFWFAEAGGKALGLVTWDSGVSSGKAKE